MQACETIPHPTLTVLSQNDIVEYQILPNVGGEGGNQYVLDVILAMCKQMADLGIKISSPLVVIALHLLCKSQQNSLALCLLRSKNEAGNAAFGADSVELAECVLAIADANGDDNLKVHGFDMLKRGGVEGKKALVKVLLGMGKVHDAIFIARGLQWGGGGEGTAPVDFWEKTVEEGRKLDGVGEKCRLLYHLYTFLKEYAGEHVECGLVRVAGGGEGGSRGSWKDRGRATGVRMTSELARRVEEREKGGEGEEKWESMLEGSGAAVVTSIKSLFGFAASR